MLKTKFNRYIFAFLTLALASIFLYPFAYAGSVTVMWFLLGLSVLAAILTLTTK